MAAKLKDFFDLDVVRGIARDLHRVHAALDVDAFVRACTPGWRALELTARGGRIAEVMQRFLPADFPRAARILVASLGPELAGSDEFGMGPFRYLPHTLYVARHGLDHFEASMAALCQLTKRFTAESSIRAFIVAHPEATYRQLEAWAGDANVHVRRLVSEGTRPRLPWAQRLRAFQQDPTPVLALLERLKDDPERYVQRSVANNLNDIGKDHPARAVEICARWAKDAPPARRWIVRHALRSLIKAGDRGALAVMGYAGAPRVSLAGVALSARRVRVGEKLRFSFELVSTAPRAQELLVDYAVHFVKASGARRPKVFKLRAVTLPARGRIALAGQVSFAPMTTRKPRPGRHSVDVLINGVAHPLGGFDVIEAR